MGRLAVVYGGRIMSEIEITCPICGYLHRLFIPEGLDYAGGKVNCECGHLITFIERLEIA